MERSLNFYSQFIDYGFDSYIQTFQDYERNYPQTYKEKVDYLIKHIPSDGIYSLQRFLELMKILPLPSKNYLVKKSAVFNKDELLEIKKEKKYYQNIQQYYSLYNLQGYEKLEINVFKHHCGVRNIPQDYETKHKTPLRQKLYNSVFLDAGAFWGDSALVLNKNYSPSQIYCFEPSSVNFNLLNKNIKSNNLEKIITPIHMGVSDEASKETLNYISNYQNHGASFEFKPVKLKTEEVDIITIDSYVENNKIKNISLIKLDVEGYGLKAIKGAQHCIRKYKPIISCGVYHNPDELLDILPILQKFNPDYSFNILTLSNSFILKELTLMAF